MKRLLAGAAIMLAAVGLQLAMVAGLLAPSLTLGVGGYAALLAGMGVAAHGALARRR